MLKEQKGFTLIELLVVVAVVGILAAAVVSGINPTARFADARDSQRKQVGATIAQALEACFTKNGGTYTGCVSLTTLFNNGYTRFNYGTSPNNDVDSSSSTIPATDYPNGAYTVNVPANDTSGNLACVSTVLENSHKEGTDTAKCGDTDGCKYWKYVSSRARAGWAKSTDCIETDVLFK